jgi:hypothetical protein
MVDLQEAPKKLGLSSNLRRQKLGWRSSNWNCSKSHSSKKAAISRTVRAHNHCQDIRLSFANYLAVEQEELNEILARHIEQEKQAGREIHPAARKQSFTEEGTEDDDCKQLSPFTPCSFVHIGDSMHRA